MSARWAAFVCGLALALGCTLPNFGAGVVGSGCVSGGNLPAGQSCSVSCNSNYTANAGTTIYNCSAGNTLTQQASLTCTLGCYVSLPTSFTATGAASPGCPRSGAIARGSSCYVVCDSTNGFTTAFNGTNGTYSCNAGGGLPVLTATTMRCTPCVVPTLAAVDTTNGCQSGQLLAAGANCSVVCNSNYTFVGSQYACSADGTLTGTGSCQAQQCLRPTQLGTGVAVGNCPGNLPAGSSCTMQCMNGYIPSGNGTVSCVSRIADGPSLTCAPAPCNMTLAGVTGTTVGSGCALGSTLQSGQTCTLACLSGYEPQGTSVNAVCSLGVLTVEINCQPASCAFPLELDTGVIVSPSGNGCVLGSRMPSGDTCTLRCAAGYSPQTDKTFTCNSGALTAAAPVPWCTPNPCTINNFPSNALSNPNGSHALGCSTTQPLQSGTTCDLQCDGTTTPSNSGTFYYSCYEGQLVNSPTGQCLRPGGCYFPPLDPSYSLSGSCNGGPLTNVSSCTVGCSNGYAGNASLSNSFSCLNGNLTSPSRVCTGLPCTLPTMGSGVTGCASGGSLSSSASCTMACDAGYVLNNANSAGAQYNCYLGNLTQSKTFNPTTFCAPVTCTVPDTPPAGFAYGGGFFGTRCTPGLVLANGASCAMGCANSYTLSGGGTLGLNSALTCTNGTLSFNYNCTPFNCRYTVPSSTAGWVGYSSGVCNQSCVVTQGTQTLPANTCCEYTCAQGYTFSTGVTQLDCPVPGTANCNNNLCDATPNAPTQVCTANPCTLPAALGFGVQAGTCVEGQLAGAGANSTCTVSCATGYLAAGGSGTYTCNLGNLTNATLTCVEQTCRLPNPLPGQVAGMTGGSNNLSCVANAVLASGKSCDVNCSAGFNASASGATTTFSCLRGVLMSPTLVCLAPAQCALPVTTTLGVQGTGARPCTFPGYLANASSCLVGCAPGYSVVNDTSSADTNYTCLNGVLDAATMSCAPNPCTTNFSAPEAQTGSCVNGSSVASGSSCTTGCASGYVQTTITHSCSLGVDTVDGTCFPAPCALPSSFNTGVQGARGGGGCATGGQLVSGSQCSVTCATGFQATAGTATYSCSFGNLTAPSVVCQPRNCTVALAGNEIGDNSTGKACVQNAVVADGDYCLSKCNTGYLGPTAYARACSLGQFTAGPTCTSAPCMIPDYGLHVVTTANNPCPGPNSTIAFNTFCDVQCDPSGIYSDINPTNNNPDRFRFQCAAGGVITNAPYNFMCFPVPCSLPYDLGANLNLTLGTCVPARRLDSGSSCTIACKQGYSLSSGQNTYSCNAGMLSAPATCILAGMDCVVPDLSTNTYVGESQLDIFGCSSGQILSSGTSCRVGCADTFTPDSGTRIFSCNSGSLISSPTLQCTGPPCTLPTFTAGVTSSQCTSGGSLAYGATCDVTCAGPGYVARTPVGTNRYRCTATGLVRPTLRCVSVPCTLPSPIPSSLQITPPCTAGGSLAVGSNCAVTCAAGSSSNGTGSTSYYCAAGTPLGAAAVLSAPTLQCTPNSCSLRTPVTTGYVVASCPDNSVGSQCSVQCAAGYNSVLGSGAIGPVTATCYVDGGSFVLAGCAADKACNIPASTPGYSVSCSGPITATNCGGVTCAPGYYGSPVLTCANANANMAFTGCNACRSFCPPGQSAPACNSTYQAPTCDNCTAGTYNNGSSLACSPCPPSTCSQPGAAACGVCPPQQASVAGGDGGGGISDGALAAAIVVPLLVVLLLIIAFVCWKRKHSQSSPVARTAKSNKAHNDMQTSSPPADAAARKQTREEVLEMERGDDGLWRQKTK